VTCLLQMQRQVSGVARNAATTVALARKHHRPLRYRVELFSLLISNVDASDAVTLPFSIRDSTVLSAHSVLLRPRRAPPSPRSRSSSMRGVSTDHLPLGGCLTLPRLTCIHDSRERETRLRTVGEHGRNRTVGRTSPSDQRAGDASVDRLVHIEIRHRALRVKLQLEGLLSVLCWR
jgi:hypothetical protein